MSFLYTLIILWLVSAVSLMTWLACEQHVDARGDTPDYDDSYIHYDYDRADTQGVK